MGAYWKFSSATTFYNKNMLGFKINIMKSATTAEQYICVYILYDLSTGGIRSVYDEFNSIQKQF